MQRRRLLVLKRSQHNVPSYVAPVQGVRVSNPEAISGGREREREKESSEGLEP